MGEMPTEYTATIALFGHPRPIFAPVTALIVVSTTLGQRRRYAVEMVIGIALGIGIADALQWRREQGLRRSDADH
jgi:uncharacterized membrane protein YgaE (UPF0421/DUF939 family)